MSKKQKSTTIDFDFGIGSIIPSTQEAYHQEFQTHVRKVEKGQLKSFKETLKKDLDARLIKNPQFPTHQNFAYVAIKELKDGRDVDALKISGLERSVTLFQELKSQGIL